MSTYLKHQIRRIQRLSALGLLPVQMPAVERAIRQTTGLATALQNQGIGSPRLCWGVTLLELLLVMSIVAILASIAFPTYQELFREVEVTDAIADIKALESCLEKHFILTSAYPETLAEAKCAADDPWGNPYEYVNIQTASGGGGEKVRKDRNLHPLNSDYDLYSKGRDGRSVAPLTAQLSQDDIIRANNGRFIGLASDY